MFRNWTALALIYSLPFIFPELHFLTATAVILSIADVIIPMLLFNINKVYL